MTIFKYFYKMFKHNIKNFNYEALHYVYTFNFIQNVSFSCRNAG